jgi:cytochrome c oxidase subunit I+III
MMFSLIYTLVKGKIRLKTPFLFTFGSVVLFILGGITGVFLGAVVLDYQLRGTYWVVAHFHYVMVGGATALFGGLYYWYPKITGKMYDEKLGKIHFALYFIGFNLLYFPMFVVWQTPRRVFEYDPAYIPWHRVATVGGFLLGLSFLVMFYNLFKSLYNGDEVDGNPWDYTVSAEWTVSSPPPLENFPGYPSYATGKLKFLTPGEADADAATTDGGTKTDGGTAIASVTDIVTKPDIEIEHDGHEDHASIWPFAISVAGFILFLGLSGIRGGGELYAWITAIGGVLTLGTLVGFTNESFYTFEDPIGERWPYDGVEKGKLGMWVFLASDVVLFGAFIGSYMFLRVAHGWESWHVVPHNSFPGLVNTYLLLTSSFAVVLALVAAKKHSRRGVLASMFVTFVLGVGFLINKALEWQELFHEGYTFSSSAFTSTFYLTTGLHGVHVAVGLLIMLWMMFRAWKGAYMGEPEQIEYFGLYWHFVDIVWLFLFPLFYIL